MMVPGSSPYGPATADRVAAFGARVGHPPPDDYRRFRLTHNGGEPERPVSALPPGGTDLAQYLLGLHDGPYGRSLERVCRTLLGRMPAGVIPVAGDPFGDFVCLGAGGPDRGRVLVRGHESDGHEEGDEIDGEGDGGPPVRGGLRVLAGSFAELLAGLREDEPDDGETGSPGPPPSGM